MCQRNEEASLLFDSNDPLWTFCHMYPPTASMEGWYGPGAAEVTWEYDEVGAIARIEVQCLEDGPYVVMPELDGTGRVTRWNEGGRLTELVYDGAGAIATSTRYPDNLGAQVSSLAYEDDGKLDTWRFEWSDEGELIESSTLDLSYDGDELVRTDSIGRNCSGEGTYVRDAGKLIQVLHEADCGDEGWSRSERTYEWSGEQLARGTWIRDGEVGGQVTEWEEEVRYRYEGDRIAEVQRDRDGEPYATYWYEYDEAGRPLHLVWWGHLEMPLPLP